MSASTFASRARRSLGILAPAFFFSSSSASYWVLIATGGFALAEPKKTTVSRTSSFWNRCSGSRYSHIMRTMRASRLLRNCGFRYAFWAFFGGTNSAAPPLPSTLMGSGIHFLQIGQGRLDEGADRLLAEVELEPGHAEELRERPGPAQRLPRPVFRDRLLPVLLRVAPDLQGAGLRNSILDIIKRDGEQMELAVPVVRQRVVVAAPVLAAAQPALQVQPRALPVHPRMAGLGVDPVLEGVDRRHPRVGREQPLQVLGPRAVRLRLRVELLEIGLAQELHAHRRHLGELGGIVPVEARIEMPALQRMERVAALVEQRLDVAVQARGVREDEGHALHLEHRLVAARRLPLPAFQVEVALRPDVVEHLREVGMHLAEDAAAAVHQLVHRLERAKGRAALGIDPEVPGAKDVDAQLLTPPLVPLPQRRRDGLFIRLPEVVAVLQIG